MSFHVYAEIVCNGPGALLNGECERAFHDIGTPSQVRERAREVGWQTSAPGGKDFCPKHRKTTPRNQGAPTA